MSEVFASIAGFAGDYVAFALIAMFLENTILTRALGTSTSLLIIRKGFPLVLFSVILTVITTLSSVLVFLVNPLLKNVAYSYSVTPLLFVLMISLVYVAVLLITNSCFSKHRQKILPMVHLSAFNCAVLGALLLGSQSNMNFASFLGFGLGTGLGFALATFLLSIAYDRLYSDRDPKAFRGFPAMLIYIGILSLSFYGLIGHEISF